MNKFICLGRLCQDPEMRFSTYGDKAIASFSVAVNRKYKRDGDPDADFFNCTAFGKTAEFCEKYLIKGIKVAIEGHLQNDSYEKDGQKRTVTKILIDSIEFAESKNSNQSEAITTKPVAEKPSKDALQRELEEELPFA